MADYRRPCGCFTTHSDSCSLSPNYEAVQVKKQSIAKRREQKFRLLMWVEGLWGCQVCGVVVHNPDLHREFCVDETEVIVFAPPPLRCKDCGAYKWENEGQPHKCR